jgi:hypothetical protein
MEVLPPLNPRIQMCANFVFNNDAQDSLSGDAKTLMFVCVSPVMYNCEETFCSLNFAARVRTVELGRASKNTGGGGGGGGGGGKRR